MSEPTPPGKGHDLRSARRSTPGEVASSGGEPSVTAELIERVSSLVDEARESIASYANATLTQTYWRVGALIDAEVLDRERANYGAQIVVTLSRQLSWSHILALLPLRSPEARAFYAQQSVSGRLTVRELRSAIRRKAFERREIANAQLGPGSMVPADTFSDPYLLDFLGLHDDYLEADLEAAILRDLEVFLLEVGTGFTFVERQKRMVIGDRDFHLDLLLYHRPLRRLVAVELKIGEFDARHEGQMKLYLKWLDRYERQEGEEAPIGLILCTEASPEQVELLEMHKDGIVVAEYWTALPSKQELEARLQVMLRRARERLARRELPSASDDDG